MRHEFEKATELNLQNSKQAENLKISRFNFWIKLQVLKLERLKGVT